MYFFIMFVIPQRFVLLSQFIFVDIQKMGNSYLDTPNTNIKNHWNQQNGLKYSVSQMQGWRVNMQDAYIAYPSIQGFPDLSIFGVFDGHGGGEVSRFVANHFLEVFSKRKALIQGKIGQALTQTFLHVELLMKFKPGIQELLKYKSEQLKRPAKEQELSAGATAVVVAIIKNKIICANAGDSRAALWQGQKCIPLSFDHKPQNKIEQARIRKTGVPIVNGRVNGLNLTRSIGDFSHKKVEGLPFNQQPITCMPDIIEVDRTGQEELLLVGCDGIWEKYGDDHVELTRYFREALKTKNSSECLKDFFNKNINPGTNKTDPYGRDNMTAIIVQFIK